jgi:putative endopeptidase
MRIKNVVAIVPLALVAASCGGRPASSALSERPARAVSLADVGLDAAAMDRTAEACTDFYQFACGGWLAKTEIPADEARWSRSFSEIDKRNDEDLHAILEEASKGASSDPATKKLGDFYGACMDEPAIEKLGAAPIADLLKLTASVSDAASLVAVVAKLHRAGVGALFTLERSADFKDATRNIAQLDQGGIGLPDRDYYVNDDAKSVEIRAKYLAHVERMMTLAGLAPDAAKQAARDVMDLETDLAKHSKTRVERRDPKSLDNRLDRAGVKKEAAAFDWDAYFAGVGFPGIQAINVTSVPFVKHLGEISTTVKPEAMRSYLAWHVVRSMAGLLSKAFVDERFAMRQVLSGEKEQKPRWKRCVDATDGSMGELLAQAFVQKRFGGTAKAAAEEMVHEVAAAFEREVAKLDWMDEATRKKAIEKRGAMAYLIGYPSKWKSYDFPVERAAWVKSALAATEFEVQRELAKVGTKVDREEWLMTPPTVNAYYDPQKNHMVFPAGILQPPFYSVNASVAVNLGGMGMVVGHELTHGFDDEGSQFGADGNLENWWAPAVSDRFSAKTGCVADQYAAYEPLPGVKLNGKLTLGENLADGGGVMLAFDAYRAMRSSAPEVTVADGFTEDQQFFLSVGQTWCFKGREESIRMLAKVDPHSPPKFRVNGALSNLSAFADAFQCKPGSAMRRENACKVW